MQSCHTQIIFLFFRSIPAWYTGNIQEPTACNQAIAKKILSGNNGGQNPEKTEDRKLHLNDCCIGAT